MAILPVTTCAQMLGIHPKTFHRWLTQADFPFAAHPTDARIRMRGGGTLPGGGETA